MRILTNDDWHLGPVRIRASAPDPLEGVRGADYIATRQLKKPVQRLQNVVSYRCRIRAYDHAAADDSALDQFIQVKAPNAIEAARSAQQVSGCAVIEVERQDAVIGAPDPLAA